MQIDFAERFLEQDLKIRNAALRTRLRKVIHEVRDAATIHDIRNLKKLKGYTSSWRIRMGDYRIGVLIKGDTVIFADFDHRKDL